MYSLQDVIALQGSGRRRRRRRTTKGKMRRSKSTSALSSIKKIASRAGLVVRKRKGGGMVGGRVRRRRRRTIRRRRRGRGLVGGCEMGGALNVDPSVMSYYQNLTGGRRRRKKGTKKKGTKKGSMSGYPPYLLTREDLKFGLPAPCLEWGPWNEDYTERKCLKRNPPPVKLKPYESKLRKAFENFALSKEKDQRDMAKKIEKKRLVTAMGERFATLDIPAYKPQPSYDSLLTKQHILDYLQKIIEWLMEKILKQNYNVLYRLIFYLFNIFNYIIIKECLLQKHLTNY